LDANAFASRREIFTASHADADVVFPTSTRCGSAQHILLNASP
jgi:hypothetical protein